MGYTIKFIFRSLEKGANPSGYLYLLKIENRQRSYKSLGLPRLREKDWDEKRQRVKKHDHIDPEVWNSAIERTLKDFLNDGGELKTLVERTDTRSFIQFIEKLLSGPKFKTKHGTRTKYLTVYKKLKTYLKSKHRVDLPFKELTIDFLDNFQAYMLQTGMTQNSATHYLKILQTFVKRSMKDENYLNTHNPFVHFTFEKKEVRLKETLTREEIVMLLETPIQDPRLDQARNMFLFQFFTGGMRVSDLLTLRFRNLTDGKLSYRMLKTQHPIEFSLTETLLDLLARVHAFEAKSEPRPFGPIAVEKLQERRSEFEMEVDVLEAVKSDAKSPYRPPLTWLKNRPLYMFLEESDFHQMIGLLGATVDEYILTLDLQTVRETIAEVEHLIETKGRRKISRTRSWPDYLYSKKKDLFPLFLERLKKREPELRTKFYTTVTEELHQLGTSAKTKNAFVFPRLHEEDFEAVLNNDNFSGATEIQYRKINRASIVYNRHLKQLQEHLGMKKTLKTHLPRTSFTNLMMKGKVNHRDISNTLGHSSISVTDEYLKTGFTNDGVNSVIKGTSDDFKSE